jgi:hypothetical protein
MTPETKLRIIENVRPLKIKPYTATSFYEDVIHPLLEVGRERKHIARIVCAWCKRVLNANYKTFDGEDSGGICESCLAKIKTGIPYDTVAKTWGIENANILQRR